MNTTSDNLIRRIRDVSSLPHLMTQVIAVANSPETSAIDLSRVVESDPSLAARVLRKVNSAAFGFRTRVTTIVKAIALLGFNEIRRLAITASVADLFADDSMQGSYSRQQLWKHLVCVGVVSRNLAMRCKVENFEEAFLAGLLHDLGIVFFDQHLNKQFRTVIQALTEERTTPEVEREFFGFDHGFIGAEVAEKWRFPASVIDSMKYHHDATRCQTNNLCVVAAVEVSNVLCTLKGISSMGIQNLSTPKPETFQVLNLERHDLKVIWEDLDTLLEQSQLLIEI